ncbi:MAG: hypothetical protein E7673_03560 [Ruminococcaceae bacterium]|nr:hypothetical protein [Oscillospiraceae bacterium]
MTRKTLSGITRSAPDVPFPAFHLELDGRGKQLSILISGIRGINAFSEREILVSTKKEEISVKGEGMEISLLESKSVRIYGRISGIFFCGKKGGKR